MAAAAIKFDEILVQILLSKNHVLLKSAALIKVRPLIPFVRYLLIPNSEFSTNVFKVANVETLELQNFDFT